MFMLINENLIYGATFRAFFWWRKLWTYFIYYDVLFNTGTSKKKHIEYGEKVIFFL